MRLLANENIPGDAVAALRVHGHDVAWVRTDRPGIEDSDVLAWAGHDQRIVLTFDKDFGELAFRAGLPATAGVILLRFPPRSPIEVGRRITAALEQRGDWVGHFAVIEEQRIRMRPLPVVEDPADRA